MNSAPSPQDVQAAFAGVLVDEWVRSGVRHAIASPGSRSTPLLIALAEAAERDQLSLHVALDERSAVFFAVGIGRATGMPAVVVTTSGTAAAELHAGVVEADYGGVPLLAVTADRPPELHDCGAPQTVRQANLFVANVRWEATPGTPELVAAYSWRSLASRSVAEACGAGGHQPGPVHLNLAFREPLVGAAAAVPVMPAEEGIPQGRPGGAPWHRVSRASRAEAPLDVLETLAASGDRGLIVAGYGAGPPEAVLELARSTGWPLLADPTSGCRVPGAIAAADSLLRSTPVRDWQPSVVLRLGAPPVSKVVGQWLGDLRCPQVLVDQWGNWGAPDRLPSEIIAARPEDLCRSVAGAAAGAAAREWAEQWEAAEEAAQTAIDQVLGATREMTEPAIARVVAGVLGNGSSMVVSSSMPVRDLEWWSRPRDGLRVIANRGANGIDGVMSTALGVAAAVGSAACTGGLAARGSEDGRRAGAIDERAAKGDAIREGATGEGAISGAATDGGSRGATVVALLGDLAFLYDAGALLWARRRGTPIDIVVVDNNGGGIFNFLPQAASQPRERFERLWGTPHDIDLCALAASYQVRARRVYNVGDLTAALTDGPVDPEPRVLVAPVRRSTNVEVHRRLHQNVEGALRALFGDKNVRSQLSS